MSETKSDGSKWTVSALYTYPVKSCQGVSMDSSPVTETGLAYDRKWMIVNAKSGRFVTQRQVPRLALVRVSINAPWLELSAPSMSSVLKLPLRPKDTELGPPTKVRVWYDDVVGRCCGEEASLWLTEFVGRPMRLLYKDPDSRRLISRYAPPADLCQVPVQSAFADVHPFHIVTDVSLNEINRHVPRKLSPANFRPNIVLSAADTAAQPYDEEEWTRIEFEDTQRWSMFVISRTPRCTVPNVDLETGQMSTDGEPMASLRKFRCVDPGNPKFVCFGMQAVPSNIGQIVCVGQSLTVRERGTHSLTEPL
ncbi:hypothetical protein H4R20_000952 [Coemansia guatemalensis]|uniref:MOSC domain-containing protein n=1 Tax=Coemansia guatemalensis TaxID=2761395 RepID=A0A9W8HXZ1_9FUNG|nr:hypothetical protein H4R20_000952 [Coemansia guatemalensis]